MYQIGHSNDHIRNTNKSFLSDSTTTQTKSTPHALCILSPTKLAPWGRVMFEKLTVTQPVMKFLAFYWNRFLQCTLFQPISQTSILILSSHLSVGLLSEQFPSGIDIKFL
jgi:hypothetical protein